METISSDIVIAGAGPAGATMALMLAGSGMTVTVVDKDRFPRNKICGDALSGKVLSILKRMPEGVYEDFLSSVPKVPSWGIRFVSPGLHEADIRFSGENATEIPGFICPRREFDAFLVSKLKDLDNIRMIEGEKVISLERNGGDVLLHTGNYRISARMIAGADGVHSIVRSQLTGSKPSATRLCTGIRGYYEGVTGHAPDGFIELFFFREVLPFYFWIFPEVNGVSNVGLAMVRQSIYEYRTNLGELLQNITATHPLIAPRFRNARLQGKAEAHALPLGMPPGPFSGDRFLLLGDAASLVDPFTGEGIGNAMASGEVAARVVRVCMERNDLSAGSLKEYDRQLYRRTGKELRMSSAIHRMAHWTTLFDLVIKKAKKNKAFRNLISSSFHNENQRKKLSSPLSLLSRLLNP